MRLLKSIEKLFSISSATIILVLLVSCQGSKEQSGTGDSTFELQDPVTESLVDTTFVEEENINDEDHGGPGISDTQVTFGNLEVSSQNFLTHLLNKELSEILDAKIGFVVLESGPGVAPIASVRNSVDDVLGISEMKLLLSDSLFNKNELPFYTWHFDKCQTESLPDAIYLDNVFIEEISSDFFKENDKAKAKAVMEQWRGLEYRYAKVFNVKLTMQSGESVIFSFTAYPRNDQLILMSIDLTKCEA